LASMTSSRCLRARRVEAARAFQSIWPDESRCFGRTIEARLHTATLSLSVGRKISVHRFEEWTMPAFLIGQRTFPESLKVSHGWEVSTKLFSILWNRARARTVRKDRMRPALASLT
jgi:hypothetical protein